MERVFQLDDFANDPETDSRCRLLVTKLNTNTDLRIIHETFSQYGEIKSITNKRNEKSFMINYASPPNFQQIMRSRPKVDGNEVFIRPIMDKNRMIFAIQKNTKYNNSQAVKELFDRDHQLVWIFHDKPQQPWKLLFASEEYVQKIMENKKNYEGKFELVTPSEMKFRQLQQKIDFQLCVFINGIPTDIKEAEVKKFFLNFGKITHFKYTNRVSFYTAKCQFDNRESFLACLRNNTERKLTIGGSFLPQVEPFAPKPCSLSVTIQSPPLPTKPVAQSRPNPSLSLNFDTGDQQNLVLQILDRHSIVGDLRDFLLILSGENDALKHSTDVFTDLCNMVSPDLKSQIEAISKSCKSSEELLEKENLLYENLELS